MEHAVSEQARRRIQSLSETTVIFAALATIPIVILEENGSSASWLVFAEWLIWFLFIFDFAVDLRFSEDRRHRIRTHLLDLAIVILSFPYLGKLLCRL